MLILHRVVFSLIQTHKNIKPPAYITNIVKHLLAISVGALPGFRPAVNDAMAPVKKIQEIYIDHYNLKKHLPNINRQECPSFQKMINKYQKRNGKKTPAVK